MGTDTTALGFLHHRSTLEQSLQDPEVRLWDDLERLVGWGWER